MRWQKKLNKDEMTHMKEACGIGQPVTLKGFLKNRRWQVKEAKRQERLVVERNRMMKVKSPGRPRKVVICPMCDQIARKLGVE